MVCTERVPPTAVTHESSRLVVPFDIQMIQGALTSAGGALWLYSGVTMTKASNGVTVALHRFVESC